MNKISCLIPSYNEGPRISSVLSIVSEHPLINEVIVIDDFSTDDTCEIVSKFKQVVLIKHTKNKGKSAAIATGLREATGDIICFIDADLLGLTQENITDLIEPVLSSKADVSISIRRISPIMDRFYRITGMDFISGERVFHKNITQNHIEEISRLPRFGLEVFLNRILIKNKCRIKIVFWDNVRSPLKSKKYGGMAGIKGDISMFLNILKTASILEIINQFIKMRRLIIK